MTAAMVSGPAAPPSVVGPVSEAAVRRGRDDEVAERDLLEELAHLLAEADEDEASRALAASVVAVLETWVGATLGPVEHDPLVLLTRRFARTHARALTGAALPAGSRKALQTCRDLLRDPAAALLEACPDRAGSGPDTRTAGTASPNIGRDRLAR